MRKHLISLLFVVFSFCLAPSSFGNITLVPFASGFTAPVDIATPGDGTPRIFVVEQGGSNQTTQPARIRIVQNGFVLATPFLNLSAAPSLVSTSPPGGERGLLGLAFHPQYASNGQFFVFFTGNSASGVNTGDIVVARYTRSAADPNVADPASRVNILTIPHSTNDNHNGGSLRFGPDGFLYVGVGDGGGGGDPFLAGQSRTTRLGKILRINVTGTATYTVPSTNPYFGATCATTCPEIWAYGVRNPWRFSFDRASGDLYIGDVGQGNWEEVNRQVAGASGGANYGWSVCEGNHRFPIQMPDQACVPPASYVAPILEYSHSDGISITGGYVYRGQSTPDLVGRYVFGDYSSKLWHMAVPAPGVAGKTQITGLSPTPSVSTFGEGPTGELYVAHYANGTIYSFSSSTDTFPDPIAFTSLTNVPLNTTDIRTTSHLVKITGLGTNTPITITGAGGSFTVGTNPSTCSSSYTSSAILNAAVDNYVCVRHTSANTANTTSTSTLTIGNTDITFVSTTGLPTFTVHPIIGVNGSVTPNTDQQITQNQTASFTVTPNSGYFANVTGTCGGTLNGTAYVTAPITQNCDITFDFQPTTFAVTPSAGVNGSISPATVQNIVSGATTTFTVTPNPGYSAGVGGTCGGTLVNTAYTTNAINAACTVIATFTLVPAVAPGAPVLGASISGDGLVSVGFTPPASNGGSAITQYTVTCAGIPPVTGGQSPIIVTGLTNGVLYSCSVTATNSAGTGPASATVDLTPTANSTLALIAVQSRKFHGGSDRHDLPIELAPAITGPVTVEPRMIVSGHQIVFQFNVPIQSVGQVAAEDAAATPYIGVTSMIVGSEVIVTLSNIGDNKRAKVTLPLVTPVSGGSTLSDVKVSVGFFVGDVNSSRTVNASDISSIKARYSPTLNLNNFRFDLNASGAIDGADLSAAKARSGLSLP